MNNMNKIRIFFDMDGVLAKWEPASIEETMEKGFFSSRKPDDVMLALVTNVMRLEFPVSVLSSVYQDDHSVAEKSQWLDAVGLSNLSRLFSPYGESKGEIIDSLKKLYPDSIFVLVDDNSEMLRKWQEAGGVGVKYYNGVNGTKGTWDGYSISCNMQQRQMMNTLLGVSMMEYRQKGVAIW